MEAGHIKPYSEGGEHEVNNGLLLRRDVHRLVDLGYVTVSPEFCFEVSQRIHDDFDNGEAYYQLHGERIEVPTNKDHQPDQEILEWHNNEKYFG